MRNPYAIFGRFSGELNKKKVMFLVKPGDLDLKGQVTLYISMENSWLLEHHSVENGDRLVGQWLPAGQYRLTFTSHSKALEAMVIDPDPSGGPVITVPQKGK